MRKQFTLIEIITSIVVLGILLSIVLLRVNDLKDKAVVSTMTSNVRILQSTVDEYYLKNGVYPVVDSTSLTLENPQLVDVSFLVKENLIKKDLNTSKIKEQYYWVDIFGKVWGSTKNEVEAINLLSVNNEEDIFNLEALIKERYSAYNVYKVNGYSKVSATEQPNLTANIKQDLGGYEKIFSSSIRDTKPTYLNYEFQNEGGTYLMSFVDEYGLETAPFGNNFNPRDFPPIFTGEGEYEFEIINEEDMYWVDFLTLDQKPGKSTISYEFVVKDKNGEYKGEWTKDFFSLPESKGIKVKITMKGDEDGNKPSLYDLRVLFRYKDEPIPPKVKPDFPEDKKEHNISVCPANPFESDFGYYLKNTDTKKQGSVSYVFKTTEFETIESTVVPNVKFSHPVMYTVLDEKLYVYQEGVGYVEYSGQDTLNKCMLVVYDLEIDSVSPYPKETNIVCGDGRTTSGYSNNHKVLTYTLSLEKGEFLTQVKKPSTDSGWTLSYMTIETSYKGGPYEKVSTITDVLDESCVNLAFYYEGYPKGGNPPNPIPPEVIICEGEECQPKLCGSECAGGGEGKYDFCKENPSLCIAPPTCIPYGDSCEPPACVDGCNPKPPVYPEEGDKELENPEWTTIDSIRFFGHGAMGQITRWYKSETSETIMDEDNTRVVYRYAKSSGVGWSGQYEDFTTTGIASSVMAVAYIQVKTELKDEITQDKIPTVNSVKLYSEKGVLDLSLVKPTVAIIASKDNNRGRDTFSDVSRIKWDYVAADPRNKEIVDVEWAGDIRENYPVGTYQIKVRVKNETAYWSDWTIFELKVLQEKPIAVIEKSVRGGTSFFDTGSKIIWSAAKSSDTDGDGIKKVEWSSNKKESYPVGTHTVKMRIQDNENHWSNWAEHTFEVGDIAYNIFRYEAEDTALNAKSLFADKVSTSYSGGRARTFVEYHSINYNFEGTGYEAFTDKGDTLVFEVRNANGVVHSQRVNGNGEKNISIMNLPYDNYTLRINTTSRSEPTLDYVDFFSPKDAPKVIRESSHLVVGGAVNRNIQTNQFSVYGEQKLLYTYKQLKDGQLSAYIIDEKGKIVKTIFENRQQKGGSISEYEFEWDGKDNLNKALKTGHYKIKLVFKGVAGSKYEHLYAIYLDNERPIFRYEAEDTKLNVKDSVFGVVNGANYSGGQVRRMSEQKQISFSFEGTGYDISIPKASTVTISRTGAATMTLNTGKAEFISVRNLPLANYTITIRASGRGEPYVDYIDVYSTNDKPVFLSKDSYLINKDGSYNASIKTNQFSAYINQSIRLNYTILKDSIVSIDVFDGSKNIRKLQTNVEQDGGSFNSYYTVWDGKNSDGNKMPSGYYDVKVTLKGINQGETTVLNYPIELDNESPIFRYEAEDTKLNAKDSIFNPVASASYSGGEARRMSEQKQISFKFEGTGYDISIPKASTLTITSTGTATMTLNTGKAEFISVRNLPLATYTIILKASGRGEPYIDYIDVYSSDDQPKILSKQQYMVQSNGTVSTNILTDDFSVKLNQKTRLTYTQLKDAYVTTEVYDSSNRLVKSLGTNVLQKGGSVNQYTVIWDGKDNGGNILSTGKYTIRLTHKGILKGSVLVSNYDVYLDNEDYVERLEGENLTLNNTSNSSSKILSDGSYSAGKARLMWEQETMRFNFTGTGYDLYMPKASTVLITDTSGNNFSFNKTTAEMISVRNLPEGSYTITIKTTGRGNPIIDYVNIYK